jgi:hypothetical protein
VQESKGAETGGMSSSGHADVFVSHAQMETLQQTFHAVHARMRSSHERYWLDYFTLRQNAKGEFDPKYVARIICDIRRTLLVCDFHQMTVLDRLWCIYEVACTVENNASLSVTFYSVDSESFECANTRVTQLARIAQVDVDARTAKSTDKAAQGRIMEMIRCGPGLTETNKRVSSAIKLEWEVCRKTGW